MSKTKIIEIGIAKKKSEERADKAISRFVEENLLLIQVAGKYSGMLRMISRQLKGEEGYEGLTTGEKFHIYKKQELRFAEIIGDNNLIEVQKGLENILEKYQDWKKNTCLEYSKDTLKLNNKNIN